MKFLFFLKAGFCVLAAVLLITAGFFLFKNHKTATSTLNSAVAQLNPAPAQNEMEIEIKENIFDPKLLIWKQITAQALFAKRDSHSVVVFKNKLWLLGGVGGTASVYKPNYNDIWTSENGKDWTLVLKAAPWPARRSNGVVVFEDRLWIFGGVTDNDKYLNDVWVSDDGISWQQVTANAGWTPRKGLTSLVFNNKIWMMGGIDSENAKNDVWYSENGKDWILATNKAPWSRRIGLIAEVFDNKIWISGGNYINEMGQKDIWNSTDGKTWNFVINAPWPGRHCHCFTSFNGYLWVIGGWSGYGHGYNDTWYSEDGIDWKQLYKDGSAPWKGREDLVCLEYQNKIFMMGGMKSNGERTNDVWQLSDK